MNKERLLELAGVIESSGVPGMQFDIWEWYQEGLDCGTVGCIRRMGSRSLQS